MQQAFKLPAVCPVCPNSALKPWIKGYAYKRSKQCDLSLKTSLEAGSSSQAAGKALTWRNHTGLTCSGSWTKVGWLSSSAATDIVKNYNNKSSITKIGDSEVCPPQWILKPLCGFIYVGYALQLSHVRGQPINEVGVGRGGCWPRWVLAEVGVGRGGCWPRWVLEVGAPETFPREPLFPGFRPRY
jgi:hypothetical protein